MYAIPTVRRFVFVRFRLNRNGAPAPKWEAKQWGAEFSLVGAEPEMPEGLRVFVNTQVEMTLFCSMYVDLPCLTETYLVLEAATKLAWGRESSREKSSSLVTTLDRVLRVALDPMGPR